MQWSSICSYAGFLFSCEDINWTPGQPGSLEDCRGGSSVVWGQREVQGSLSLPCCEARDGDSGRISAKGAGGLCRALEPTLDVPDAVAHQVKRQVHPRVGGLGTRRHGHPSAGSVRGLALGLRSPTQGNASPSSEWGYSGLRIHPKLEPTTHRQEDTESGRNSISWEDSGLELWSWFCLALHPWWAHLTFLNLCFLDSKMRKMVAL